MQRGSHLGLKLARPTTTPIQTSTETQTPTPTETQAPTPTETQTPTPTETQAPTPTETQTPTPTETYLQAPTPSIIPQKDMEILDFTNQIRQNPKILIPYLIQLYDSFQGNIMYPDGQIYGRNTDEGPSAVLEAIEFLNSTDPVGPLVWDQNLADTCQYLVEDIGPKGLFQHENSNGETFSKRVNQFTQDQNERENRKPYFGENLHFGSDTVQNTLVYLIIDDNVPNRGHRTNIFAARFKRMGGFSGPHARYDEINCMDFSS
eukprot:403359673